jgi:hypothetical protein
MRDLDRIARHIRRRYRLESENGEDGGAVRFYFGRPSDARAAKFAATQRGADSGLLWLRSPLEGSLRPPMRRPHARKE